MGVFFLSSNFACDYVLVYVWGVVVGFKYILYLRKFLFFYFYFHYFFYFLFFSKESYYFVIIFGGLLPFF